MTDRNELERLLADDKAARAYGGFPDCLAEHLRNNAQHYLSLMDEVERLRAGLRSCADLVRRYNGRQTEKLDDIPAIVAQALGETK
jgi:hypothetical protein